MAESISDNRVVRPEVTAPSVEPSRRGASLGHPVQGLGAAKLGLERLLRIRDLGAQLLRGLPLPLLGLLLEVARLSPPARRAFAAGLPGLPGPSPRRARKDFGVREARGQGAARWTSGPGDRPPCPSPRPATARACPGRSSAALPLPDLAAKLRQLATVGLLLVLEAGKLRGHFLQPAGRCELTRRGDARLRSARLSPASSSERFFSAAARRSDRRLPLPVAFGGVLEIPRRRASSERSSRARRAAAAFSARACASASPERTSISRSLWTMRIRPVAARLSVRPGAIPWCFSGAKSSCVRSSPVGAAGHGDG